MVEKQLRKLLSAEFELIPPKEELMREYNFSKRHKKKMQKIFREELRLEKVKKCFTMVRKAAVVALTLIGCSIVTLKIIPTVYAYVETWIVELADDRVIFKDKSTAENCTDAALRFEMSYVPEGYEFLEETYDEFGSAIITYKNSAGERLRFEYCRLKKKQVSADIENIQFIEIFVNGIQYYVFGYAGEEVMVAWEKDGYLLNVHGILERQELTEVAVNVNLVADE